MKQITKPLVVSTTTRKEHLDVIKRLTLMGFTHGSGYSAEHMMTDWEDYTSFEICNIVNKKYSRNASRDSYDSITPASKFLAEYGPAEVAAPTVTNPPNFYIDTENVPALRKIAQELAFGAGLGWSVERSSLVSFSFRHLLIVRSDDLSTNRKWRENQIYHGSPSEEEGDIPVYSAATQLGEIIRILSSPAVPPAPPPPTPPEIHGYKAVYAAGSSTVDFGCAQLGKNLLRDAAKLMGCVINGDGSVMRGAGIVPEQGCNRAVDSITLSFGKTLSRVQIKEILDYIAAIEEYAKKYPQKSP